ncbi:hypothetical protein BDB00DRAFT_878657 [Zychaea mexicana]|uniref:uncharacterized protein n=1 Tax=Zychaea mexicana TaxID=64656 RepID=UPI0022FEE02B|nr:uncharacterized protein BDB00DRAFT_878657 [Zychaea mexicana]KAI9484589.1 hypothetical protein BDB00DRAFT_878657 [Zychaea mexicana]
MNSAISTPDLQILDQFPLNSSHHLCTHAFTPLPPRFPTQPPLSSYISREFTPALLDALDTSVTRSKTLRRDWNCFWHAGLQPKTEQREAAYRHWRNSPDNWEVRARLWIHSVGTGPGFLFFDAQPNMSPFTKGIAAAPSNYRPISLTSVFCRVPERCLLPKLLSAMPAPDTPAQGGFRHRRGVFDEESH